jgi:hypothetical protein
VTIPELQAAQTLLPFLERILNALLAARAPAREAARGFSPAWGLRRVALDPRGATLELAVSALGGLVAGSPRIRLEILSTSPDRTECRWHWSANERMSRLAGRGLSLLPREQLERWLRDHLGEGVRLEGERLVLEHAVLAARFRRGSAAG